MAVAGGRIMAVGSAISITAYIGADTEVIDLGGKLVMPAFVDTHVITSYSIHYTKLYEAGTGNVPMLSFRLWFFHC